MAETRLDSERIETLRRRRVDRGLTYKESLMEFISRLYEMQPSADSFLARVIAILLVVVFIVSLAMQWGSSQKIDEE